MNITDLKEQIDIELEFIENTLVELTALSNDIANHEPTTREKAAAGVFLAQFYSGIENIIKRICKFNLVSIPNSASWHIDLFKQFCDPSNTSLPMLFDKSLASDIAPFRQFRHVVYHSYGFQLDWERMKEGILKVEDIFIRFMANLSGYLDNLPSK